MTTPLVSGIRLYREIKSRQSLELLAMNKDVKPSWGWNGLNRSFKMDSNWAKAYGRFLDDKQWVTYYLVSRSVAAMTSMMVGAEERGGNGWSGDQHGVGDDWAGVHWFGPEAQEPYRCSSGRSV